MKGRKIQLSLKVSVSRDQSCDLIFFLIPAVEAIRRKKRKLSMIRREEGRVMR